MNLIYVKWNNNISMNAAVRYIFKHQRYTFYCTYSLMIIAAVFLFVGGIFFKKSTSAWLLDLDISQLSNDLPELILFNFL